MTTRLASILKNLLTHSSISTTVIVMWNEAILKFHSKLLRAFYIKVCLAFTSYLRMLHSEYGNNPQHISEPQTSCWALWLHCTFLFLSFLHTSTFASWSICDIEGTAQLHVMMLLLTLSRMTHDNPADMLRIWDLSFLTLPYFISCFFLEIFFGTSHPCIRISSSSTCWKESALSP